MKPLSYRAIIVAAGKESRCRSMVNLRMRLAPALMS